MQNKLAVIMIKHILSTRMHILSNQLSTLISVMVQMNYCVRHLLYNLFIRYDIFKLHYVHAYIINTRDVHVCVM